MAKFVEIGAKSSTGVTAFDNGKRDLARFLEEGMAAVGNWREARFNIINNYADFTIECARSAGLSGFRIVPGEDLMDFLTGSDLMDDEGQAFEVFSLEGVEGTYWTELIFSEMYDEGEDGNGGITYGYRGILVKLEDGVRYVYTDEGWVNPLVGEGDGLTEWQASFCTEDDPPEGRYIIGCCREAGTVPDSRMKFLLEKYKPVFRMARKLGREVDIEVHRERAFLVPVNVDIVGIALSCENGAWSVHQCIRDLDGDGTGGEILFEKRVAKIGNAEVAERYVHRYFDHYTPGGMFVCVPVSREKVIEKYIPVEQLDEQEAYNCQKELATCNEDEQKSFMNFLVYLLSSLNGDGSGME